MEFQDLDMMEMESKVFRRPHSVQRSVRVVPLEIRTCWESESDDAMSLWAAKRYVMVCG